MSTTEPTLAAIQGEREARRRQTQIALDARVEADRLNKKRSLLAGFAQGLEELDREIAASKELRKKLKESVGKMKEVRDAMADFATVDDLSFDDIIAHTETVRKAARETQALRGIFNTGFVGGFTSSVPRISIHNEQSIADMMRVCCGQQDDVAKAA